MGTSEYGLGERRNPSAVPVPLSAYDRRRAAVGDTVARVCASSSDRIPQWLLPVIRAQLDSDGEMEREVFGDLADDDRFVSPYRAAFASLHESFGALTTHEHNTEGSHD